MKCIVKENRIKRFKMRAIYWVFILIMGVPAISKAGWKEVPSDIAPIDAPFAMPDLQRPDFPDRTIDIRDYGAKALDREEIEGIDFSDFE